MLRVVDVGTMRAHSFVEWLACLTDVSRVATKTKHHVNDVFTDAVQACLKMEYFAIFHLYIFALNHVWASRASCSPTFSHFTFFLRRREIGSREKRFSIRRLMLGWHKCASIHHPLHTRPFIQNVQRFDNPWKDLRMSRIEGMDKS